MMAVKYPDNDESIKDSGKKQKFKTGAHRDTQKGKGRFDLIPPGPLFRLAKHYEMGANKYGENNWKKGMPSTRYLDSALRHLLKYADGSRDEDHLAAVLWNVIAIMWNEESNRGQHDLT